ncbi:MAG: pilus assembly protein TadG-related protein [Microbacteriaceae bacterium]
MRASTWKERLATEDDGSTLFLTIFFAFLSLVLVLLVVAATSLYLERKRLFTLADGAALVGAEAFELDSVRETLGGWRPVLEASDVAAAVTAYIDGNPTTEFESLTIEQATTVDGKSATVSLSAYWRPPLVSLLVPDGFRIDVTAVARSVFG